MVQSHAESKIKIGRLGNRLPYHFDKKIDVRLFLMKKGINNLDQWSKQIKIIQRK